MRLQREENRAGLVYYFSPLLREAGVPHAFSTRLGGVSSGPFDALNLGNPGGEVKDEGENIARNYGLLFEALQVRDREHCWLHQIHGAVVARVAANSVHDNDGKGDALVTCDGARVVSVRVADCCPVLLASADGRRVAAVHSGWRGTVAEAAVAALEVLLKLPGERLAPHQILAAIGPCIGLESFETGAEVLAEFERVFGAEVPLRRRGDGSGFVDIRAAIRVSLLRAGVLEKNIDTTELCTHRDSAEFFSHRRERGVTGRMAALIAPK